MSLIAKQHHQNRHGHGHGVYIKDGFPCGRDQQTRILIRRIWHLSKVPLSFSLSFHFHRMMFGRKSETIVTECPSARFHINGDFSIDQKESLIHSKKTDEGGADTAEISPSPTNTYHWRTHTCVPNATGHLRRTSLVPSSHPALEIVSLKFPSSGTSGHSLMSKFITKPKVSLICRSRERFFGIRKLQILHDSSSLVNIFQKYCLQNCLEWVFSRMESVIPERKIQQKPNSPPWFTPECHKFSVTTTPISITGNGVVAHLLRSKLPKITTTDF